MSRNTAMDLVLQFMGRQNTIPTPVPFIRILGDHTAAAFLAQCLYWGDRTTNPDGWFHKTHEEWHDELVLTPDQVRRCVRTCGALVEVKRAGIPARNHYRANRDEVAAALERLALESQNATASCRETQQLETDKPHDRTRTNPTASRTAKPTSKSEPTSEPTPNLQKEKTLVADATASASLTETPDAEPNTNAPGVSQVSGSPDQQANAQSGHATSPETVPGGAAGSVDNAQRAVRQTAYVQIIAAWNAHCAPLPRVETVNDGRKKSVRKLLTDCSGDVQKAVQTVTDAARDVARDPFWLERRYGFDNLVPGKVFARAEAWRSRTPTPDPDAPTPSMAELMAAAPLNPVPGGRK
ncbi:hypothetical protein [Deinococcus radiopugnans]|nr:hypothetical protein [Deinococcus radiopugnans]